MTPVVYRLHHHRWDEQNWCIWWIRTQMLTHAHWIYVLDIGCCMFGGCIYIYLLVNSALSISTHTNINDAMIINKSEIQYISTKIKTFLAIYILFNHFPNSTSSRIYHRALFSLQFFCRFLRMVGFYSFSISSLNQFSNLW